ncbi:sugar-binding transcriptional regulator [Bacillus cihuensis]|uniref:sugar-binding transcriptional regulator n=1 Tax=Bacillus cihuensis TaxID=1208599 RepID=UPI0004206D67|nr:sugar-binding transcriptional regulator [Bacillus cihuensis]
MNSEKIEKMVEAAKLYHLMDFSQMEVAKKLGVSRPTVSKILQQAREEGIVEIKIMDPSENCRMLEEELEEKFGLKKAIVVSVPIYEENVVKQAIGKGAADYVSSIVNDGDTIGITWGTTMYQVALHLKHKSVRDVKIIQLKGGVSHSQNKTYASEALNLFEKAFDAKLYQLPLPAIVDHIVVKQAIDADRHIRKLLTLGKEANIAIYTVGVPQNDSLLFQLGYFSEEDEKVISEHAVGDIASRFFDKDGHICNPDLNARTIGVELDDLKNKEHSILVAGGLKKIDGIRGAIKSKMSNVLITDANTAKILLNKET